VARSGRQTSYSRAGADAVLEHVADGASLRQAFERAGIPRSTFLTWVKADREALCARYQRALTVRFLVWLDDCREQADDSATTLIARRGPDDRTYLVGDRDHIRRIEAAIIGRQRLS
jgi:hypothetical protein